MRKRWIVHYDGDGNPFLDQPDRDWEDGFSTKKKAKDAFVTRQAERLNDNMDDIQQALNVIKKAKAL